MKLDQQFVEFKDRLAKLEERIKVLEAKEIMCTCPDHNEPHKHNVPPSECVETPVGYCPKGYVDICPQVQTCQGCEGYKDPSDEPSKCEKDCNSNLDDESDQVLGDYQECSCKPAPSDEPKCEHVWYSHSPKHRTICVECGEFQKNDLRRMKEL
jgi:hypothetical protein